MSIEIMLFRSGGLRIKPDFRQDGHGQQRIIRCLGCRWWTRDYREVLDHKKSHAATRSTALALFDVSPSKENA